jgi:predicted amidohydrolase
MCQAEQLMDANPNSDLYVLPEMWSTGFGSNPTGIGLDEDNDPARSWMVVQAHTRMKAICGSVPILMPDGSYRNRHYFIDPLSPHVHYYDKHHLFTYGHEDRYFTPGQTHCLFEYLGVRFLLLTCYDLRFPCWSRYSDRLDYDVIIVVANWPSSRQSAWRILTRARAVENQCYLIGVNRVGDDQYCHYAGSSVVCHPYGHAIAQCHRDVVEARTVNLDMTELRRIRQKFRVLDDRD